jgi:signal transduction histidine kinase/tetratricopeptide (TPR) repeat protein
MKLLLALWLLFFLPCLFAQSNGNISIDSLESALPLIKEDSSKVKMLNDLSLKYQFIDAEKGLEYGISALLLAKKLEWKKGISESQLSIGANHYFLLDFQNALASYEEALNNTDNQQVISTALKSIGLIYSAQSNFTRSLEYYFRALKISEASNDKALNSKLYANIGTDYARLGQNDKAIDNYLRALKINQELGNKIGQSLNYQNLGNLYFLQNQEDQALDYIQKSMTLNEEVGNKKGKIYNLESLTDIYISKSQYAKALNLTNEALILSKEIKDEESEAYETTLLGSINFELGKLQINQREAASYLNKAEENYMKAILIHTKMNSLQELAIDYEELSKIQSYRGSYKMSLDNYRISVKYKDSVFNSENKETIKNLEDKREIELKDKQIELNNLTIATNRREKLFLTGGLLLLGIIGGLLFYQGLIRKKNNKRLNVLNTELNESNKIKNRLLSILNHDLRSPINRLIHFLQLLKNNPELLDEEVKNRMIDKNMAGAENLLVSMDDILLWSKGQMANFGPKLAVVSVDTLFESTKNYFLNAGQVSFHFQNLENLALKTDKDYLKTILRNLTANAVGVLSEVSNATINWKAWKMNSQIFLSVTDNGPGITVEESSALYNENEVSGITTGLGLHLIRDLAKAISCKITVESKPGFGTTFILEFPQSHTI